MSSNVTCVVAWRGLNCATQDITWCCLNRAYISSWGFNCGSSSQKSFLVFSLSLTLAKTQTHTTSQGDRTVTLWCHCKSSKSIVIKDTLCLKPNQDQVINEGPEQESIGHSRADQALWDKSSRSLREEALDKVRSEMIFLVLLVKAAHQFFSKEELETAGKTHCLVLCFVAHKAVWETKYCSQLSVGVLIHSTSSLQCHKVPRGITSPGIGIY